MPKVKPQKQKKKKQKRKPAKNVEAEDDYLDTVVAENAVELARYNKLKAESEAKTDAKVKEANDAQKKIENE